MTSLATLMSSLPSQLRPDVPTPSPTLSKSSLSNYRVFAAFCRLREPTLNSDIANWIECYNPSSNTWSEVTSIPDLIEDHVLKGFSMVSLGDSVFIIGGRLCQKKANSSNEFFDVGIEVRSKVMRYNILSNEWSECAPLRSPRYDFACSTCDNKIYVAGGKSTRGCVRGLSSAEMYDPILNEWTTLPSMNTLRYKCVGVTWQGKIYVVGGFAERGDSDGTLLSIRDRSSAEVYDTQAKKWDLVVGMWQLDVPPNQIVAVGGRLFSSGDCYKAWKGHIEAYDGRLSIWNEVDGSHLQNLNSPSIATSDGKNRSWEPIKLLYLTMAPIGTHLYFLVGYRSEEISRSMTTVRIFDTLNGGWQSLEPMEEEGEKELCSHCCVAKVG